MTYNALVKLFDFAQKMLVYKPPDAGKPFVLEEKLDESVQKAHAQSSLAETAEDLNTQLRYAHRLEGALEEVITTLRQNPDASKIAALTAQVKQLEKQQAEIPPILLAYDDGESPEKTISASLEENSRSIKLIFRQDINQDIALREFIIPAKIPVRALLVFSMAHIDKKEINGSILAPLLAAKKVDFSAGDPLEIITTQILPINFAVTAGAFPAVVKAVTDGNTVLFVDGAPGAIIIETRGLEHRGIAPPRIEQTIRGNQAAFIETLRINISLVKRALRSPDMVADVITIGRRSRTECAVMYLQSVANPSLVAEVKRRLKSISTDALAPGTLEQFIEDHPWLPPQILSTERPDRVSAHLAEGRVAILIDGDPFALVVPVSLFTLFHSAEDFAMKIPLGTFMRLVRFAAAFFAAVFPAIYIAVTYYHQEAVPTELVLTIAGARERIPFPAIVEVIIMEISFEFIREAGLRKPGLLGETIGIVGGIILGQAVVAANVISSITVVVIAIAGVAAFAIPDFRTGMAVRQARFLFLFAAAVLGLIGVAMILFVLTVVLCSMKSFGVPYIAPIAPKTIPGMDVLVRGHIFRQEARPDELNTLEPGRQPSNAREWDKNQTDRGSAPDELQNR